MLSFEILFYNVLNYFNILFVKLKQYNILILYISFFLQQKLSSFKVILELDGL